MRSIGRYVSSISLVLIAALLIKILMLLNSQDERFAAIESLLSKPAKFPHSGAAATRAPDVRLGVTPPRERSQARTTAVRSQSGTETQDIEQRRQNRLSKLAASFASEQVDNRWAAQTEAYVHDALAYAAATADAAPIDSSVTCKSRSCRIDIDMPGSSEPEDLLLQLSVDMSEILPHSKTVVLTDNDGNKRLSMFAER